VREAYASQESTPETYVVRRADARLPPVQSEWNPMRPYSLSLPSVNACSTAGVPYVSRATHQPAKKWDARQRSVSEPTFWTVHSSYVGRRR
jgi:hypothetical protein